MQTAILTTSTITANIINSDKDVGLGGLRKQSGCFKGTTQNRSVIDGM